LDEFGQIWIAAEIIGLLLYKKSLKTNAVSRAGIESDGYSGFWIPAPTKMRKAR
jgi:hypothetical protein